MPAHAAFWRRREQIGAAIFFRENGLRNGKFCVILQHTDIGTKELVLSVFF